MSESAAGAGIPTNREELHQRLTEKFVAMRAIGSDTYHNPQADISVMMDYMFNHIGAALRQNAWPELTEYLADRAGVTPKQLVENECRDAHNLVFEFVKAAFFPTPEQAEHVTFMQTLDDLGWRKLPLESRIAYLYMMGLFYLSRCWVIGRQTNELGLPPQVDFDLVSDAVGIEMRMFDQDINPRREAREVLRAAIGYAMHLGLSEDQATAEVLDVYTEPDVVKNGVDVTTLNKLARKTGGIVGQEKTGGQS